METPQNEGKRLWQRLRESVLGASETETKTPQGVSYNTLPHFINSDGKHIFCNYWEPKLTTGEKPRSLVFICHGAAEHCLWYDCIAEPLVEQKCFVFAHDHVGHGQSQGDRVHTNDFMEYIRDVIQHVKLMKEKYPFVPVFVIGHSMGGAITVRTVLEEPDLIQGMVLIAPIIVPKSSDVTPFLIFMARVASIVMPQYQVAKIDPSHITRDPEQNKKYDENELNWHGGLKARWAICLMDSLFAMQPRLKEIEVPFLTMHGNADKIVDVESSEVLVNNASSEDKELKVYDGFYHQLHFDTPEGAKKCRQDIVEWLLPRMDKAVEKMVEMENNTA